MNLFQNILNNVKPSIPSATTASQFIQGRQEMQQPAQVQPTAQPKPQAQKMILFSDEVTMLGKMKADGLDDDKAMSLLKQRRNDLFGGNTMIDDTERTMLEKMRADNLSAKEATKLIAQRRKDTEKKNFEKAYSEGNIGQKALYNFLALGAGNLETTLKYGGNILDAATFGKAGFGEDVKAMQGVTQAPQFQESTAFKVGGYLPDAALAISPIGGGYLAGAKGGMLGLQGAKALSMQGAKNMAGGLMARSAVVGAGFGGAQPILEKGSDATMGDIATGAGQGALIGAVATPVISKALKYGQAGYRGGLTGMGKSISRDVKSGVKAITPSGANISTRANRFNANEIREFKRMTGESPGEFATSRGMTKTGDDAVVEATNLWHKSKEQADEALTAIKGRFRFTDEGDDLLKTTIDDLETRLVNVKSPDAKRISQLKAKYGDSGLTMSEINEVKRAYSNNYKYGFTDVGSEASLRSRNLQDAVRKWQFKVAEENGLTNLKEINKTTQGWKTFADSLGKKLVGSSANNAVSLTDAVMLSGGGVENIALYLGRKLASSDTVKRGAIKLFSKQTKPSIIKASKADILNSNFQKNVNRGVSGVGDNSGGKSLVRPVGLLPAPSGQATGAKNFRVNQPKEAPAIKSDITSKSKIVRPGTSAPIKEDIAKTLLNQKARQQTLSNLKDDIARATESARYGGTGNSRIEQGIQKAINDGTLTPDEAKVFAREILQDIESGKGRYSYINKPKLKEYVDGLTGKKETFEELLISKPAEVVAPKTQTPKQIYDKLNEMANDGRYGEKSWNALADEFKQKTGKDIMDMGYDSFDIDGNVKVTPKTIVKPKITKEGLQAKVNIAKGKIVPKKIESSPIVKKEAQKTIVKPVEKKVLTPKKESATIGDMENPIVNKQTGETLNQAIEKLRKNNWSEKDIQKFKDSVLGKNIVESKTDITKTPSYSQRTKSSHTAPVRSDETTSIIELDKIYPKNIYSDNAHKIYSSGYKEMDKKAIEIFNKVKGNPNATVTIYRAIPSKYTTNEINAGDWVAITKEYAIGHGKSNLGGNYKILSKKVNADEIITDGNSIQEFGYDPRKSIGKQSATIGDMETKKLIEEYNKTFENVIDELKSSETASVIGKKYGLTPEETHSIYEGYTNPNFDMYTDINLGHRRGEEMSIYAKVTSEMMDSALAKIPSYKGSVYRGISRNGNTGKMIMNMSPGDTFTDKGFLSSSKVLSEAENFSLKGGIIMKIESKTGKDITKLSYSPEEAEVLFPRNTNIKYLGKNGKGQYVFQEI